MSVDPELLEAKKQAYRLCGTTNLIQAFKQIEAEREEVLQLHDKKQALTVHIHRMDEMFRTCNTIIVEIERNTDMFTPEPLMRMIERYKVLWYQTQGRLQEALKL